MHKVRTKTTNEARTPTTDDEGLISALVGKVFHNLKLIRGLSPDLVPYSANVLAFLDCVDCVEHAEQCPSISKAEG